MEFKAIQDIVFIRPKSEKRIASQKAKSIKVKIMSRFEKHSSENHQLNAETTADNFSMDQDLLMEQILDNLNSTPIGKVVKKIALLPEVRQKKVLDVRERLSTNSYDLNDRLDCALDKVLEELMA